MKGKRVLVLGLGDTGMSMVRWCARQGAVVSVADTRPAPPRLAQLQAEFPGVAYSAGEFDDDQLRGTDLIAISPGVDRRSPAIARAIDAGTPVVGDIELFARALAGNRQSKLPKIVAITGTNGKSTVTRMVGDICLHAGWSPVVAGNIGTPVLDTLAAIDEGATAPGAYVLELSSFQLESTVSLNADAATVLNISEDHLDRYDSVKDYVEAKKRVFAGCGAQVLNREDTYCRDMQLPAREVHHFGLDQPNGEREWGVTQDAGAAWMACGDQAWMPVAELPVAGLHNVANALAAAALAHAVGVAQAATVAALKAFQGLPHRVERVAEVRGITFFDDSKGTNVGAAVAALNGFTQPVVLIAGGDGKGQDFGPLREPVKRRARAVVLIGRDADRIHEALRGCGVPLVPAADMRQAVERAHALCNSGDAVLLSPACASFDMFRNYVHRGEVFAAEARRVAGHGAH